MHSLQTLSDRVEIQDLLNAYCFAIDARDFEAVKTKFTSDAILDYSASDGPVGDVATVLAWVKEVLQPYGLHQHMISSPIVTINGDEASSRCILFNPMVKNLENGPQTMFFGLWYEDDLVRTEKGWLIKNRRQKPCYMYNYA